MKRLLLLLFAALPPASAQFQVYLLSGNLETTLQRSYDLGSVDPGGSVTLPLRIRNTFVLPATMDFLSVNGAGFTLTTTGLPQFPMTIDPQKSIDITVTFQSAGIGTYSASLDTVGTSVILVATVPSGEVTKLLDTGDGLRPLSSGPVDFGRVERGSSATRRVLLVNQTSTNLFAPALDVSGVGFALSGELPTGILLNPTASVGFELQFSPLVEGSASGVLNVGNRSYPLNGIGLEPPLPRPHISVSLPQSGSAQQGTLTMMLDAASRTSGTGSVMLNFTPAVGLPISANDTSIAFASGGQMAAFSVSPGDTQARFGAVFSAPFQTGTTAGTLTITAQLGEYSDQQTITIVPAPVGVTAAAASRTNGYLEIDLTGFDNTRSASTLAFTFFDANGNAISGGPIQADGTASFASYFEKATAGTFTLRALFPVTGDASQIKSFQAAITNSAGSVATGKTSF